MTMHPIVGSSNVAATGHDPNTNRMHVQFHNGRTYEYRGVTDAQHKAMRLARSVGGHFDKHFKKAGHVGVPVE